MLKFVDLLAPMYPGGMFVVRIPVVNKTIKQLIC
jgi:hypothetical protein